MKKITALFAALIMLLSLAACGAPASGREERAAPSAVSETQKTVVFADPALEKMICGAMGKPAGSITKAEAAAVTRLDLSFDWQRYLPDRTQIKEIGGLECFTSLESLDLSYHAITDISSLAGLSKLALLALAGNPVADISPLSGLTSLKVLVLSGCAARDYSPLANLACLAFLKLDNSTIEDASPLAGLTNLKRLYLSGCELDYSPLAGIYPNIEERDFTILPAPSTLAELGFYMDGAQAVYDGETVSVRINHIEWGTPMAMGAESCVRTVFGADEYKVDIGYYPGHDAYIIQAYQNGGFVVNYVYHVADGSVNCSAEDRERFETHLRALFPGGSGEDLLLAPISFYNAALENALGMTAAELYALPFSPPSLINLGFVKSEEVFGYQYVYRNDAGDYFDISIHDPKQQAWEGGGDVRFFTPLSEEYRIVVTYHIDEKRFAVGADDNDGGGAEYSFFIDSNEHADVWCSDDGLTVEQYFMKAINDPLVTDASDIYQYSVKRMIQTVEATFGMGIEELYALPAE